MTLPFLVALLVVAVGVGVLLLVLAVTSRLGPQDGRGGPDARRGAAPGHVVPPREGRPLPEAVQRLTETTPFSLVVALDGLPPLPEETEDAAYDAVAECLGNTALHADATRAWVRGELDSDLLRLGIGDDGRGGADPDGPSLAALRRQVAETGGTAQVHSPPGGPTLVSLVIPLPR